MRMKFPDPPKKESVGKSDVKQADQKKETKSPAPDAAKNPGPGTKKVEAKK